MNTQEPQVTEQSPVDQFKQGHPQPQPTAEQLAEHKSKLMKEMKEDMPFLRMKEEYDKLQAAQLEQQVLLGQRGTKEVPGLLGLELQVREVQALEFLTQWKNEMERRMETVKAHDEELKKAQGKVEPSETATGEVAPLVDTGV